MYRLQQFLVGNILPDMERLKQAALNTETQRVIRAQLAESFLWLHLGAELGAFPEKESFYAYRAYFLPFFGSLTSKTTAEREKMQRGRAYVAHSMESELLVYSFPRFASVLMEKAMRGDGDIFSAERSGYEKPGELRSAFKTLLILFSNLERNYNVFQFTYNVSFAAQDTWQQHWTSEFSAQDVLTASSSDTCAPRICAGFVELWGYASKISEILSDLGDRISTQDMFRLAQRLREMQSWRINLKNPLTARRFEQVRNKIAEGFNSDVRNGKFNRRTADLVQGAMDATFESWFAAAPMLEPA